LPFNPASSHHNIYLKYSLPSPQYAMSTRKRKQDEELVALPSDESEEEEE
jgi:hypothetical protein